MLTLAITALTVALDLDPEDDGLASSDGDASNEDGAHEHAAREHYTTVAYAAL